MSKVAAKHELGRASSGVTFSQIGSIRDARKKPLNMRTVMGYVSKISRGLVWNATLGNKPQFECSGLLCREVQHTRHPPAIGTG